MKTALITGASGGIGSAIAKRFIEEGYQVVLHYNHNYTNVEKLKQQMNQKGYQDIFIVQADLTNQNDLNQLMEQLKKDNLTIDVLVNNAGIKKDALVDNMDENLFMDVITTNVLGTFNITKRLILSMKEKNYGRIINISSGLASHGGIAKLNYGASKAAIENMTKNLAKELGPFGITVNTVAPGLIETEMTKDVTDKEKEAYIKKIPIGRLTKAEDVAQACIFFADEKSDAISNQVVGVNGGLR